MARFIRKKKEEIGASPDELIYKGENKQEQIELHVIDYNSAELHEKKELDHSDLSELTQYVTKDSVTWINFDGIHNLAFLQEVKDALKFDSLVIAEVFNTDARPRMIEYDDCILVTLKMLRINEQSGKVMVENLSLIMTDSLIISFQEQKGDVFEPVRDRIRRHKKRIRERGTDYLLFALLDIIIDNYLYVITALGEKIDAIEKHLLIDPDKSLFLEINKYKQQLIFLRKCIKPAFEMVFSLAKSESDFIEDENYVHYQELENNISQANDAADHYREILSDQLNIYHTTISSKLNDTMKFLTVFSVIFIPLTFITGVYGTNFHNIPELNYQYGYYIMLGVLVFIAILMLIIFKIKKWF